MGTMLQQFGHDLVLRKYIGEYMAQSSAPLLLVSPAMGPWVDIVYWDADKSGYVSAYYSSQESYIPELANRYIVSNVAKSARDDMALRKQPWYKDLSSAVGADLAGFAYSYCRDVEAETHDLPDIMAFSSCGNEVEWVELKYEGFGRNARHSVLAQQEAATKRGLPFSLIVPKIPFYGSEVSNHLLRSRLPREIRVLKFTKPRTAVAPVYHDISFEQVN